MAIVMVITKVILDICKHRGKKNLGNERDGTGDWVGANRLGGQERPFEEVIREFSCEWKAGLASWMFRTRALLDSPGECRGPEAGMSLM